MLKQHRAFVLPDFTALQNSSESWTQVFAMPSSWSYWTRSNKNMICSTCWLFARAKRWQAQARKRASWGFNSFWSPSLNLNASSFVNFMMNVDIFIEYYYWVRSRWLFWTPTFMAGVETCTEFAGKLIETRFIVLAHNCRWFIFTNNSQEGFTVRGGPSSQRMI